MEPQVQQPVTQAPQGTPPRSNRRKLVFIGGSIVVALLILFLLTTFLSHTNTPGAPENVTPTPVTGTFPETKQSAPQIVVVSDAQSIVVSKVDTSLLKKAVDDSHVMFQPSIRTVVVHISTTPLADQTKYMQSYMDASRKVVQGGVYETTSGAKEDIYIYRNPQDLHTSAVALVTYGYWIYTLNALWYIANMSQYQTQSVNQLETLQKGEYQFTQTHGTSAYTLTVQ